MENVPIKLSIISLVISLVTLVVSLIAIETSAEAHKERFIYYDKSTSYNNMLEETLSREIDSIKNIYQIPMEVKQHIQTHIENRVREMGIRCIQYNYETNEVKIH